MGFNWKKKNLKGRKIAILEDFLIYMRHKNKVFLDKRHNNHPQNERCDHLAFEASKSNKLDIDHEYERQ